MALLPLRAAELVKAGHTVVVFDNLYQGHREAVHPDAAFVEGDLRDVDAVARLFTEHTGFDGIMHFASFTLVGESMQQPLKYLRENLIAGANLLEESKFFLERLLHWFERIHGLKYACLRYFNAAGDTPDRGEDHDPELHLIPIILQVALGQRARLTIFGGDYPTRDGTCVRDYVHVLDLAQAHILAMEALDRLGSRKYNLGNGNGFSNLEMVEAARTVTGHPIPYQIGPRRPGDPAVLIASSAKIRAELGWAPQYPTVEQIIASAWEWHSRHPRGYQS